MTSREKFTQAHPDAIARGMIYSTYAQWHIEWNSGTEVSETKPTEGEAWDDAASKLPPGSPAGETASEPDDCEVCRGAKGGVKGNENVVDGKKVCDYCHAGAVPEPVPPEGAAEVCEVCLGKGAVPNIQGLHLPRIPCHKCGVAPLTDEEHGILSELAYGDPALEWLPDAARHALEMRQSAAPIVPAAEKLIQGLVDALWEAAQSLRTIADGAGRREFMEHMDQVRGYANSRANVAHELAEEYRKGAKNG